VSGTLGSAPQLIALGALHRLLERHGIEYWLFGGWAVDFHAGAVTREHADLDIAVWLADHAKIAALLAAEGWKHTPERDEDGSTVYARDDVRLEVAFLARDDAGEVYTPLREGRAAWAEGAFGDDLAELRGVRARVITLDSLRTEKAVAHDDPVVTAKDRADLATLAGL
jgi:Uncharacterised nucleotidyltransferase